MVGLSRRAELAALGRRSQQVLLLSAVTGGLVGLGVALFEWITRHVVLDRLLRAPLAVQALGPLAGLALAGLALRYLAAGAGNMAEELQLWDLATRQRIIKWQTPGSAAIDVRRTPPPEQKSASIVTKSDTAFAISEVSTCTRMRLGGRARTLRSSSMKSSTL